MSPSHWDEERPTEARRLGLSPRGRWRVLRVKCQYGGYADLWVPATLRLDRIPAAYRRWVARPDRRGVVRTLHRYLLERRGARWVYHATLDEELQ